MIYHILDRLGIPYEEVEHEAVYTVEDIQNLHLSIEGIGCKNLFLTDGKHYYLYILKEDMRADLKALQRLLGVSRLSFASSSSLEKILHLSPGSVTPFGIIHDSSHLVQLLLDSSLKEQKLLFHPNVNTRTISISFADFIRFIEYEKHSYCFI